MFIDFLEMKLQWKHFTYLHFGVSDWPKYKHYTAGISKSRWFHKNCESMDYFSGMAQGTKTWGAW